MIALTCTPPNLHTDQIKYNNKLNQLFIVLFEVACAYVMIIGIDIAYTSYKIKDRASKISLWMTTLSGHKSAQALTEEEKARQTDQINEYFFFVSTSGLESNEALTKEDVNKTGSEKGALKPDQSASFFLPD